MAAVVLGTCDAAEERRLVPAKSAAAAATPPETESTTLTSDVGEDFEVAAVVLETGDAEEEPP